MAKYEIFNDEMESIAIIEADAEFIESFHPNHYRQVSSVVPQVVSPLQANAALLQAGLLETIESFINFPETSPIMKLAWNKAIEFRRNSPMVLALQSDLGWSDEQLDNLFILASSIEV